MVFSKDLKLEWIFKLLDWLIFPFLFRNIGLNVLILALIFMDIKNFHVTQWNRSIVKLNFTQKFLTAVKKKKSNSCVFIWSDLWTCINQRHYKIKPLKCIIHEIDIFKTVYGCISSKSFSAIENWAFSTKISLIFH